MLKKKAIHATRTQLRKIYREAWERDGGICQICGEPIRAFEYSAPHHIVKRSRLHLDVVDNIACCHKDCHLELELEHLDTSVDDLVERFRDRLEKWL